DLEAVDELDVAGVDGAGALLVDPDGVRLGRGRLEDDLLQVEDDVGDVLDDVADRRELVEGALDPDRGDRRALERGEEHATERVAEGDAVAALERLAREAAVELGERLLLDVDPARPDEIAPVASDDVA